MAMPMILLSISLCMIFPLLVFIKFIRKVWWTPIRIQSMMKTQGVKGPSYKFLYGNNKEITNMMREAIMRPMDISERLFPRIQPHLYAWMSIYGRNFLNWHGSQAQLVVTDLEMIKEILQNNKDGAFIKMENSELLKEVFGDGLLTTRGEKWTRLRKLANHAFHGESLKSMVPEMIASTEMMLDRWKQHEGKEIEVFEEFRLLTSEVISRTAFGSSYVQGKHIFEMLAKMIALVIRNTYKTRLPGIGLFFKTSDEIESRKLEKVIRGSILEMVKNREEKVMSGESDSYGTDFFGLLLQSNKQDADEKKKITVDEIIDECKTFYVAGQETTNSLLAWTVFLLATHTDWQEEARREVRNLFGQQTPTADGIARLKIVNMIINESLRLYPPAAEIVRSVGKETRLGKYIFPANMNVYISIPAIHNDPSIWGEDVHLFKPERFSEGVAKATNNNIAAFIPFGLGSRTCVGFNFVATEAKVALSMILQRYSFTISPTYVHSPAKFLIVQPQRGVQVILHAAKGAD